MSGTPAVIGYLSGAPRVSTRPDSLLPGPRAHVLGVIGAFERRGFSVRRYIRGDEAVGGFPRTRPFHPLLADLVRLAIRPLNARRAVRTVGTDVRFVYERLASMQSLGRSFQRKGVPWVLETNAPLFLEAAQDRHTVALQRVARRLELDAYARADAVVCVSHELRRILCSDPRIDAGKVLVMPNAVDGTVYDPAKSAPRRFFGEDTLCFVGALEPWQGLDRLLHAVSELVRGGRELRVVVAGDGPMRKPLEALAAELKLSAHVRFLGRLHPAEVPGVVLGSDLCYSGQVALGCGSMYLSPLKLYEYQALGRPVLASRSWDATRLVRDGETGWLFDATDASEPAASLKRAIAGRSCWPAMGREARRLTLEKHSWDARVAELLSRLERLFPC